jgi:hypothetical protein
MVRLLHWPPLVAALLVCLAVLGCGSNGHPRSQPAPAAAQGGAASAGDGSAPRASGPNGSAGAEGAPVANAQNDAGGSPAAPGAPIQIPDITILQGAPVDNVRNSLETGVSLPGESKSYQGIIAQCGGQLCVAIDHRPGNRAEAGNYTQCQSLGDTDPPRGSMVYPRSTIWILTGTQPCTSSPSTDQSPPAPGTVQSPTGTSSP